MFKRVTMMAAGVAALAMPIAAQAQARMTVASFLGKVAGLKQKGPLAIFSPDVKLIKSEMRIAATELKTEGDARKAAGKPPIACPPTGKGAKQMGSDEFLKALQDIPPAERNMTLKQGLVRVVTTKYPCR